MSQKIGVLLVNLGTPQSPEPKDVYRYLIEFLTDERVIDLPWLRRQLLVRGMIVPTRYKQSAQAYREIWTAEGSPLMVYGRRVQEALQQRMGDPYCIELAMRYQTPSIKEGIENLLAQNLSELLVVPLFPQYASATTGSVLQRVMEELSRCQTIPKVTFLDQFATHPAFIEAFVANGRKYPLEKYDHILISFHGLPQKQLQKADRQGHCLKRQGCCRVQCQNNASCYGAQCYATAHGIANGLGIPPDQYTVCFQSRLGKDPWLQPYASEVIHQLAKEGCRNVLVFCPSFVCDCLETLYEFGVDYAREFHQAGGSNLDLVEGLNAHPHWIDALEQIISEITPIKKGRKGQKDKGQNLIYH